MSAAPGDEIDHAIVAAYQQATNVNLVNADAISLLTAMHLGALIRARVLVLLASRREVAERAH